MFLLYHSERSSQGVFMEILSVRMKELRKAANLKQTDVADALGISISAYCRYEYGQREPDASTIAAMATFYNVSADYLLGLSDES